MQQRRKGSALGRAFLFAVIWSEWLANKPWTATQTEVNADFLLP
jgi:hypothetical protein